MSCGTTETIETFHVGTLVVADVTFKTKGGSLVDPTTVSVSYKFVGNDTVTKVFGVGVEVVQDSEGKYHIDITTTVAGRVHVRWFSTGTAEVAVSGSFNVEPAVAV